jgi:hypothetical protein
LSLEECLKTREADQARRTMRNCQKPCLQTCWANPDSDYLSGIINRFIENVRNTPLEKKIKKELFLKALSILSEYEDKVKECLS